MSSKGYFHLKIFICYAIVLIASLICRGCEPTVTNIGARPGLMNIAFYDSSPVSGLRLGATLKETFNV